MDVGVCAFNQAPIVSAQCTVLSGLQTIPMRSILAISRDEDCVVILIDCTPEPRSISYILLDLTELDAPFCRDRYCIVLYSGGGMRFSF